MSFVTLVFYAFSAILLASAVGVVTARNTVHAVLLLVLAFVTAAGIWLLLEAEFLAITLVLVYVGAVTVLFLFVVMTIDINIEKLRAGFWNYLPLSLGVGVLMAVEMVLALKSRGFDAIASSHPAGYSNTKELGRLLYTDYVYPFEIAAVILLVAMIAAIAITMRKRKTTKYQNPAQQVSVRREDRVRLISMPSERRGAAEGDE
ncbi:MAG: NADH-quinone oxidoreductase subunit J [Sulfuricellaceae bacterium]|nr:NADH-quinone oxidoreductase subunit J [Sulfuricellaceae bacterium]